MNKKRTETDVAKVVLGWMQEQLWDCYPEVEMPGGRADIVGVRPFPFMNHRKCVHIVECKTSWTLTLLEQAVSRLKYAHFVSVAAPTRPSNFFRRICSVYGIGMIEFTRADDLTIDDYRAEYGRMSRHAFKKTNKIRGDWYSGPEYLIGLLHEDMKQYQPGVTSSGGYSTPWRRTMDACVRFINSNPGCDVKDLLKNIDYHYSSQSSARQGFLLWLQQREDVNAVKEGKQIRFYPQSVEDVKQ